jgi:hypothetical protein
MIPSSPLAPRWRSLQCECYPTNGPAGVETGKGNSPKVAAASGLAVVSGLARGIDQAAMAAALTLGFQSSVFRQKGIGVTARSPEIRRRAHAGERCIASVSGHRKLPTDGQRILRQSERSSWWPRVALRRG